MVRKQGAPRSTKLRHVNSHPSSSQVTTSTSFSAAGVRARKINDVFARNNEYAGELFFFSQSVLQSHLKKPRSDDT